MFNLFKKSLNIVAPISGKTIQLSEVPDPVFAEKMVGDGIAIDSTGDTVVAPCDGTISLIMDSKHAFSIKTTDGIELLVHIGLETVSLNGEGFETLQSVNTKVSAGTPILKIDRKLIESKGLSLITPVIIVNHDKLKSLNPVISKQVSSGKDVVLKCSL